MGLLLTNIGLLASPVGSSALKGCAQGEVLLIRDAVVGVEGGRIVFVGRGREHGANDEPRSGGRIGGSSPACLGSDELAPGYDILDCGGRLVTPGLVDSHTHLVFGGWRHSELAQRLGGASYLDILKSGGGILRTVGHTRAASEDELYDKGLGFLAEMLSLGVTTCEAKSGYGLSVDDELKQLRVIRMLSEGQPIDIVPTFMGAHAVPAEYSGNREGYIELIIDEMLPTVAGGGLAEFCDIFCETAVFTPEESRKILLEAARHGFRLKAHVDEIDPIGGAEMAAEVGAVSAEHLIQASDAGIRAMAEKGVIAVLLPATSFYLDKPYARARDMVDAGVAVAVATDFNPGSSPSLNMQFAMNLACLKYRLTPAEALTAVTLNAAAAINRAESCGSIEVGKQADLVIWEATDLEYIFYRYGSNLTHMVVKNGKIVGNSELRIKNSELLSHHDPLEPAYHYTKTQPSCPNH